MNIWHKFTSPDETPVSGKVGGAQWNEEHCFGAGAIIPLAVASFGWDVATGLPSLNYRSPNLGDPDHVSTGRIELYFPVPTLALDTGLQANIFVHFSALPTGAMPTGWTMNAVFDGEVKLRVDIFDADGVHADLPLNCNFWLTASAVVVPV